MQLVEMLNRMKSFDEKEDFCKNFPFHRRELEPMNGEYGKVKFEWSMKKAGEWDTKNRVQIRMFPKLNTDIYCQY